MLTRARFAAAVTALAAVALAGSPAWANPTPTPSVGAGDCGLLYCVDVHAPGSGGKHHSGGSGTSNSKGKHECRTPKGTVVPCSDPDLGTFSSDGCYYYSSPERLPAPDDPSWKGHKEGDGKGQIYWRTCPDEGTGATPVWLASPPGATQLSPAQLAQQAIDSMKLGAPDVHINPKPGGRGLVGLPVWMWAGKGRTTWGPNTATASAGGVTVTAAATVSKVTWSMGDGSTVVCTTPGTPYNASYGKSPSPDCGHVYAEPSSTTAGGSYRVTATSTWSIHWTGGGQQGDQTETRSAAVAVTIGELQLLN